MADTVVRNLLEEPTVKGALGRIGLTHVGGGTLICSAAAHTNLSPEDVFEAWSDITKWSLWCKPLVVSARWLEKRAWDVGAKFEQTLNLPFPIGKRVDVEMVKEVNPGQSVSWWKEETSIRACHIWFFEPQPDGTTRVVSTEVAAGPAIGLEKPFIRRRWQWLTEESVKNLVRFAEREHSRTVTRATGAVLH